MIKSKRASFSMIALCVAIICVFITHGQYEGNPFIDVQPDDTTAQDGTLYDQAFVDSLAYDALEKEMRAEANMLDLQAKAKQIGTKHETIHEINQLKPDMSVFDLYCLLGGPTEISASVQHGIEYTELTYASGLKLLLKENKLILDNIKPEVWNQE